MNFAVSFPFISRDHVHVYVNATEIDADTITWVNDALITLATAPANAAEVLIRRETSREELTVNFQDGPRTAAKLNLAQTQRMYVEQELQDDISALMDEGLASIPASPWGAGFYTAANAAAARTVLDVKTPAEMLTWLSENEYLTVPHNILPNTQFEIISDGNSPVAWNEALTAASSAITCSGNNTGNNTVTINCADTDGIIEGRYYLASAAADAVIKGRYKRILTGSVVADTSFQVYGSKGAAPSGTSSFTMTLMSQGDGTGSTASACDNWSKTVSLLFQRNEWRAHMNPGSVYSGIFKKTAGALGYFLHSIAGPRLDAIRGRPLTFKVKVKHQVKAGTGRCRPLINSVVDGVGTLTYGSYTTTTEAFEQLGVSIAEVPAGADYVDVGTEFGGTDSSTDMYVVDQPMAAPVAFIPEPCYMKPPAEFIFPVVKTTPPGFVATSITFPSVVSSGTPYYSFPFDVCGETDLVVATSIRAIPSFLYEFKTTTHVGSAVAIRPDFTVPVRYPTPFLYSQVSDKIVAGGGHLELNESTPVCYFYTPTSAMQITAMSVDLSLYRSY